MVTTNELLTTVPPGLPAITDVHEPSPLATIVERVVAPPAVVTRSTLSTSEPETVAVAVTVCPQVGFAGEISRPPISAVPRSIVTVTGVRLPSEPATMIRPLRALSRLGIDKTMVTGLVEVTVADDGDATMPAGILVSRTPTRALSGVDTVRFTDEMLASKRTAVGETRSCWLTGTVVDIVVVVDVDEVVVSGVVVVTNKVVLPKIKVEVTSDFPLGSARALRSLVAVLSDFPLAVVDECTMLSDPTVSIASTAQNARTTATGPKP